MNDKSTTVGERIVMWGVPLVGAAIMTAVSLISLNPLLVKSTLLQCGALLFFAIWAIEALKRGDTGIRPPLTRVMLPALAFMASAVFSYLFVTSSRDTSLEELMVRIPYFMVFLVAAVYFADPAKIRFALFIITIASCGVAAYGMVQHFGLDPFGQGNAGRIQSTFGNPNFYVGFLTLAIPAVAAAYAVSDPKMRRSAAIEIAYIIVSAGFYYALTEINGSRPLQAAVFALLSAGLVALRCAMKRGAPWLSTVALYLLVNNMFLTRSRSGQIGLGVALIVFVILAFLFVLPKLSRKKIVVVALGSLVLAGLVTAGVLYISYSDEGRLKTVSERKYYVEGALNLIGQKPLFGHGIGTFKNNYPVIKKAESWAYNAVCFEHVSNVYNEHLEIVHDEGMVGIGVWIWLVAAFFLLTVRAIRASGRKDAPGPKEACRSWLVAFAPSTPVLLIALVSGIAALLVSNIFSLSMRYASTGYFFWLFMGFAAGCAANVVRGHASGPSGKGNGQRLPVAAIRVFDAVIIVLAAGAALFSVRVYLADVYLNDAVNYSKDAYTPVDAEGKVFHDIFIEGTRYVSDSLTWEKALRYYKKSLENNPFNLRARYFYGNAFNRRWNMLPQYNPDWGDRAGNPRTDRERAMAQYEYIIAQAPHFTEIDFELGDLYMKLGDVDRAIAAYRDYKRYKPFFTKIHYTLANAYVAKQEWANAAEAYKDALDLNQKFTIGYLELAAVYEKLGKKDLSAEMFERAREESPDKVYMAMAEIWQRFGEQERSLECLHKRIAQDSTDARPYARLGWIAIENKRYEEAVALYEKVVCCDPRHAPAWVNLSNLYYTLGRMDDAKKAYQRAYAIDPLYVRSIVQGPTR